MASAEDRTKIHGRNLETPHAVEACLHHLFADAAGRHPDQPAILTEDGEITYRKLDSMANRLANHLSSLQGIGEGMIVPLCFDKSSWAIIAMLAVLKAGAAYCCLDPAHPQARHEFLCRSVKASILLVSPIYESRFQGYHALSIDAGFFDSLQNNDESICLTVKPDDVGLVAFTSGSTGVPKGIVHTHRTICTGLVENAPRQHLHRAGTRVFQWAAYTFDVALTEIYAPLIHGGVLCIRSEDERLNSIDKAMNRMKCEWAFFTPSFSRFCRRFQIPTLKTLFMGGEAIMADDVEAWRERVRILQAFGPAECVTWFVKDITDSSSETISFGRPPNIHGWIVDPDDSETLLPIGAVGELLIEGPALFVEYLNDPAKTEASIINAPSWRTSIGAPSVHQIYKSGDLVQYLPNGEMTYAGRKDAMIKLRGQRIDLGEIEHVLRINLEDTAEVAVDLIVPPGKNRDQVLVAFIHLENSANATDSLSNRVINLQTQLRKSLPEFMVPRIYYPIDKLPYNTSRKLDRWALRQFASALTFEDLVHPTRIQKSPMSLSPRAHTPAETYLQNLWAEVLAMESAAIKLEDNFFALGGSSLAALRLVSSARDGGYDINYTDVFRTPSLQELAAKAKKNELVIAKNLKPFALIAHDEEANLLRDAAAQCHVASSDIEDMFPLTPQQEGLWALSLASNGSYVAHFQIRLRQGIDRARFRSAWNKMCKSLAFMRTRIIQASSGAYQVILKDTAQWKEAQRADEYIQADLHEPLDFGVPLTRYAFMKEKAKTENTDSSNSTVIWTSHHALYDGHSVPLFLNAVAKAYRGVGSGQEVPFSHFVRHLQVSNDNTCMDYWRSRYQEKEAKNFPKLPYPTYRPSPSGLYIRTIAFEQRSPSCITKANFLRAALALTITQFIDEYNVNYLEALDGRSAPVLGVESIIGPTFATVPRNTVVDPKDSIESFLLQIQNTSTEMVPYAQYGLQNIRNLSPECAAACEFQTILVIEPTYQREYVDVFEFDESGGGIQRFNSDCVMWKCNMNDTGVELIASFDKNVIKDKQLRSMVNTFEENIYFLCNEDQSVAIGAADESHAPRIVSLVKSAINGIDSSQERSKVPWTNGTAVNSPKLDRIQDLLRKAWIETLEVDSHGFTVEDDFFISGGNSIRAMEFVASARRLGVSTSVARIFRNPVFKTLAATATLEDAGLKHNLSSPLFGSIKDGHALILPAALQCDVDPASIEDILSATPLQAEFMASTQKKAGAWMAQTRYSIPDNILRTRIIQIDSHGTLQVVVNSALNWTTSEDLSEYMKQDRCNSMGYGHPLVRYAIVDDTKKGSKNSGAKMVLTIHHSLYDGFTLTKLHHSLYELLSAGELPTVPSPTAFFDCWASTDKETEKSFWKDYLSGLTPTDPFPALPSEAYTPRADTTKTFSISFPTEDRPPGITVPSIILAAWALLISHSTKSSDIAFGLRVSGRSAPVPEIMDMLQPTIAHVPVRVRMTRDQPVSEFLRKLQTQQSAIVTYEQAGLSNIAEYSGSCRAACSFQNMLVIQTSPDNAVAAVEKGLELEEDESDYQYFNDWVLLVDCYPSVVGDSARLVFSYDSNVLEEEDIEKMARQMEDLVRALNVGEGKTIGDIRDLEEVRE